jgi:hypothetical protein
VENDRKVEDDCEEGAKTKSAFSYVSIFGPFGSKKNEHSAMKMYGGVEV